MDWKQELLEQLRIPLALHAALRDAYYEQLAGNSAFANSLQTLWFQVRPKWGERLLYEWSEEPRLLDFASRWKLPHCARGVLPSESAIERWALWAYWNTGVADLVHTLNSHEATPPKRIHLSPLVAPQAQSLFRTVPAIEATLRSILTGCGEPPPPPALDLATLLYFPELETREEYLERIARYCEAHEAWLKEVGLQPLNKWELRHLRNSDHRQRIAQVLYLHLHGRSHAGKPFTLAEIADKVNLAESTVAEHIRNYKRWLGME